MTIEEQVISLELAKKLKKLGVEKESLYKYCGGHLWYHDDQENGKFEECPYDGILGEDEFCPTADMTCEFFLPAYTTAELGELLPTVIEAEDGTAQNIYADHSLLISKTEENEWEIVYEYHWEDNTNWADDFIADDKNEANARAKMLIRLIEEDYVSHNGQKATGGTE